MTYKIRRSADRKYFDHGWLKTFHTFSFGSYYDPEFMGFRDLRVINEDRVDPGHGFPPHEHKDMEIISIVLEGELAHEDSMGTKSVIQKGDVQAMNAGEGVTHSEFNPSSTEPVHFLQIWIFPNKTGINSRYSQVKLPSIKNEWVRIASKEDAEDQIKIEQDVELFSLSLEPGIKVSKELESDRYGWLQVVEGEIKFNADTLKAGDAVAIDPSSKFIIEAVEPTHLLYFNLK